MTVTDSNKYILEIVKLFRIFVENNISQLDCELCIKEWQNQNVCNYVIILKSQNNVLLKFCLVIRFQCRIFMFKLLWMCLILLWYILDMLNKIKSDVLRVYTENFFSIKTLLSNTRLHQWSICLL